MKYSYIVWDFNGTLMNDVDIAVAAVNDMLLKRGMEPTYKEKYLKMVTSPIIDYYKKIFDLNVVSFDDITEEFLESYNTRLALAGLMPGAAEALDMFDKMGMVQCVISSFEQRRLENLIGYLGISQYFDEISGAGDIRSEGKLDRGLEWLRRRNADPSEVLVIGDLVHDFELARYMGTDCVLISAGHQHETELKACGVPVFRSLNDMLRSEL